MPGHYNEKDPHTLKPGKSKLHGMFQNIKHNPNQPYHFIRSIGAGLTFLPIGRAVGAGVKLIRRCTKINNQRKSNWNVRRVLC